MKFWIALACFFACPAAATEISSVDLARIHAADVLILGEVHDNEQHHRTQALAVGLMKPKALVFEMLTEDQAQTARSDAAKAWADSGWGDFDLYAPIFKAAAQAAIYGANLPRGQVKEAVAQGAAKSFGAEAALYGLAEALSPDDQAAREAEQAAAHCNALPPDLLPGMVQAQRLRDAALARAVVQAMAETGGPVVVITGSGHARKDQGVPSVLALAAPSLSVVSVGQLESDPGPDAPYDFWIVTPPQPRDDPCAGLAPQG